MNREINIIYVFVLGLILLNNSPLAVNASGLSQDEKAIYVEGEKDLIDSLH